MNGKPDVLIINSYAGSITIGAHRAKLQVRGSYEDCGFGLEVQRANFPKLNYLETTEQWPRQDLSSTLVMAHPPCSAFSLMTPRWMQKDDKKLVGLDSGAFKCTVAVLEYAMRNKCAGLCIESVPGAYEGARAVHEGFAKKWGYDLYRVVQNAVTFGVPQWRPRFWAVFFRKGLVPKVAFRHLPRTSLVGEIVMNEGTVIERDQEQVDQQYLRLQEKFDRTFAAECFTGKRGTGTMVALVTKKLKEEGRLADISVPTTKTGLNIEPGTQGAVVRSFCERAPYVTNVLRFLPRDGFAPTVLAGSWWAVQPGPGRKARALYMEEYKRIMGFPDDYEFPGATRSQFRMYLSKGVVPAVAEWLAKEMVANMMDKQVGTAREVEPGATYDVLPLSRSGVEAAAAEAA